MKASQLIEVLQKLVAEHGDREVFALWPDESYQPVDGVRPFDEDPDPRDPRDGTYKAGDFRVE